MDSPGGRESLFLPSPWRLGEVILIDPSTMGEESCLSGKGCVPDALISVVMHHIVPVFSPMQSHRLILTVSYQ